ncbi:hypothetical protein BU17DRAFT_39718 [Hysterangium stoloniferum]|nr:hypothetical protein BU17DRAFT_39718 [Hysterangium stoloniferum]
MGCHLVTKEWVDNHWSLILWKMIGMACLEPEKIAKKWSWDEVMRQLHMRYQRELAGSSRPALRLITTQDAPPSGPIVLCISNIFWTDEHIDDAGQSVPAHPELEITDGWYRLRAKVDESLARAARNKVLRTGRKIACSGARLDSSKKDPMEILEAYDSVRLILSGNSTHLASWHTSLGFQSTPFVATLRSLTPDGGGVPLLDLIITNIYPIAFIEFITLSTGEIIREGPRIEKDEAIEEARWQAKRTREAAKLQESLEKRLDKLESFADRLDHIAGGFNPSAEESPPDNLDNLVDELEDSEDPTSILSTVPKDNAGWLALLLRKKCETDRNHISEQVDRELATSFTPRQVRNFRVLCIKDARIARRPSTRTAQLTVWDAMSMQNDDGGGPAGSFRVGQRYLVSNLIPTQQSAWMGLEPGSEVYLSTKRDSKWRLIS